MPRFVVQQHFRDAEDWHYDFMLECGDTLVTFTSGVAPDDTAALPCLVRQIQNHRLAYLEHEGDVGGGRGWCTIHDRGTYEWIEPAALADPKATPDLCHLVDAVAVRLAGEKSQGLYRLTRETKSGADYWRLRKHGA